MKELPVSFELDASSLERSCAVSGLKSGAHVHVVGACGTGMAAVLTLLKSLGFRVSGSDKAFYPPMGEIVRKTADRIFEGYSASNLDPRPDFAVIGNSLSGSNVEVQAILRGEIPFASMPEIFAGLLIGDRKHCPCSVVVSGTHGKTTTTAAVATMFDYAGYKPGYFVGGVPKDLPGGIRSVDLSIPADKRIVVLEGDEYDSAFFSKYSKFHAYRPDIAIVTSVEFDHADIYNTIEEIELQFTRFVQRVPKAGRILIADSGGRLAGLKAAWSEDPKVVAPIYSYGERADSEFRLLSRRAVGTEGQELEFSLQGLTLKCHSNMSGPQNAWNQLAVAAIGHLKGLSPEQIAGGTAAFHGVLRRQHVLLDTEKLTLIEDFAHHPTAVKLTLQGLKESYPDRRLIAVFEPRSNTSRRSFFQKEYAESFSSADLVVLQSVAEAGGYSGTSAAIVALDVNQLAKDISANGSPANVMSSTEQILRFLKIELQPKDVVVLMSNGDFGGLPKSLVEHLQPQNTS